MAKYLDYDGFVYALKKLVEDLGTPDLSDYVKFTNYASASKTGVIKVTSSVIPSGDIQEIDPTDDAVSKRIYGLHTYPDGTAYVVVPWESGSGDGTGLSTEDQEFLNMLKKYMAETNPNQNNLIPVKNLANFFGELYNNNAGLWNRDSSKSAANFYIYDFDADEEIFGNYGLKISLASTSYAGVMSATDKTHLDDLWTAYQSGALGGGGDVDLSAYASKDKVVQWFNLIANDGYYMSWHHTSGDRLLNFHTAYFDNAESEGLQVIVKNAISFPVVESDDIINIKVLTSAEYSALTSKDSNTMYCITD